MWRTLNHWTTKQRCKPSKPPGNSDPWRLWPLQKDDTPATSQTTCSEIAEECGKALEASTPRTRSDLEGPSLQPAESTAKVLVPDITGWSQRSCVLVSMGQIQVRCTSLQWLIRRLWWPGQLRQSFGSLLSSFVVWRGGLSCREAPQLLGESCTSGGPSKKTVKCLNFTCLSRVLHKNRFHPDLIQGHFHSIGLENRLEIKGCSG